MSAIKTRAGYRWKNNVIFKVYIDTSSTAKMWRLRTNVEHSGPQPIEQLNVPVTVKLGNADVGTYVGTVTIQRIREQYDPGQRFL